MLYVRALIAALRGDVETTRLLAQRGLELVPGKSIFFVQLESVLGFLELSLGDAAAAAEHLRPLPALLDRMGYGEPSVNRVLPNAIEALVQLGELDEARPLVDKLEERGRSLDSPWSLATGARCRGLLFSGAGDLDGALEAFHHALSEHERMPGPFERGRTLLALGSAERRLRQQRAARESLAAAKEVFEQVGTPLWTVKARKELARVGGRAPRRDGALTETERRIAELVARGMANKEVAATLFVTVRTVEANLTRIYAKLGIRRRTELARHFSAGPVEPKA
ncbi:MAG TPA: LuxR C-terminal-related transcriptional regulator [Gaiellaceae bacterium]|nr:LuxR C-terminal-related transcriptional regulator [Gaiellaceae bacterium]